MFLRKTHGNRNIKNIIVRNYPIIKNLHKSMFLLKALEKKNRVLKNVFI